MPGAADILVLLAALSGKVLLLVALCALAARLLRRASAACRHVLWTAVLGGVLVLALATPLRLPWSLPIGLPAAMLLETEPGASGADPVERLAPRTSAHRNASAGEPLAERRWPGWVAPGLVLAWTAGVGLFVLRLVAGRIGLLRARFRGRVLESGPVRAALDELGARPVALIETEATAVPATWGVFRPLIALPAGAEAWPPDRLTAVLAHELAHVQRRDALTRLGADLCRALLWFHPAVWFARWRMLAECERACDDAVLAAGAAGVPYAETLLDLASARGARAAMAMAGARALEARLRAILDPTTPRTSSRSLLMSGPALALAATVSLAGLDLRGPIQTQETPVRDAFLDERIPFTREQEEAALGRSFRPRDAREEHAFACLREAAGHEPQHAMDLVRGRALWALSIARPDRVVEPLIARLADSDWRARAYAAWGLALVGVPEAREALTARLDDPVWRVRSQAACALAHLADARSFEPMLRRLDDPAWQVRMPAVEYLGRIGTPEARAAVRGCLTDSHVAVRTAAEAALGAPSLR